MRASREGGNNRDHHRPSTMASRASASGSLVHYLRGLGERLQDRHDSLIQREEAMKIKDGDRPSWPAPGSYNPCNGYLGIRRDSAARYRIPGAMDHPRPGFPSCGRSPRRCHALSPHRHHRPEQPCMLGLRPFAVRPGHRRHCHGWGQPSTEAGSKRLRECRRIWQSSRRPASRCLWQRCPRMRFGTPATPSGRWGHVDAEAIHREIREHLPNWRFLE